MQNKIVSVYIKNFMSIKEAVLEFDERQIISICGYNDSGKSAITRLLEIMFYNTYSMEQVKYIHTGEEEWECRLTFSDDVVYTRKKFLDGKSFWGMTKGDTVLYTNKLENGTYAAIMGNPTIIDDYLGVIKDDVTGEQINIRRNTDKLFLINTSGSDNYKILNAICRSDMISNASMLLNEDRNKATKEVNEARIQAKLLNSQVNAIVHADMAEINTIEEALKCVKQKYSKLQEVQKIIKEANILKSVYIQESIPTIDMIKLSQLRQLVTEGNTLKPLPEKLTVLEVTKLHQIKQLMEAGAVLNLKVHEKVLSVETSKLTKLIDLMKIGKELKDNTTLQVSLQNIDSEKLNKLIILFNLAKQVEKEQEVLSTITTEVTNTNEMLTEIISSNNLKVCTNCGKLVS